MNPVSDGLSVVSDREFTDTIANAHNVDISSFLLEDGPVLDSLVTAAKNGANVHVTLAGDYFPMNNQEIRDRNLHAAAAIRRAGGHVDFHKGKTNPPTPLHAKLAMVDGQAYLNERNWPDKMDTIIHDERPEDIPVIQDGLAMGDSGNDHLSMHKKTSLGLEAETIRNAPGHDIRVETESLSPGDLVDAMVHRSESGDNVRFIMVKADVKKNSQKALDELAHAGVDCRLNPELGSEKMATVDDGGDMHGWVGSSNATAGRPDQVDWGMQTDNPDILAQLKDHFDRVWDQSEPLVA